MTDLLEVNNKRMGTAKILKAEATMNVALISVKSLGFMRLEHLPIGKRLSTSAALQFGGHGHDLDCQVGDMLEKRRE